MSHINVGGDEKIIKSEMKCSLLDSLLVAFAI